MPADRIEFLAPAGAIKPTGAWSLAVRAGDFVFVAGMRGIDPATNMLVEGAEARIRQAFLNMKTIIEASRRHVASCRAARGLCHRYASLSASREQNSGRALGRRTLPAAHHRRGGPAQSGRYRGGGGHVLLPGRTARVMEGVVRADHAAQTAMRSFSISTVRRPPSCDSDFAEARICVEAEVMPPALSLTSAMLAAT